jgi:hypothetical protein
MLYLLTKSLESLHACRYASVKSVIIGLVMTFFSFFDVPVFWPILLMYWCILFVVTMKRQIKHMIKYRYIPFSWGKKVSGVIVAPPLIASPSWSKLHVMEGASSRMIVRPAQSVCCHAQSSSTQHN